MIIEIQEYREKVNKFKQNIMCCVRVLKLENEAKRENKLHSFFWLRLPDVHVQTEQIREKFNNFVY